MSVSFVAAYPFVDKNSMALSMSLSIVSLSKGLYAAGEVANGNFYNMVYPASGTSIQMSLTFGRVAGTNAAKHVK